jgi:glycosyl transferase family 25
MKTYLINLDRRADRLDFVSRQLEELSIPFIRFAAIDGQKQEASVANYKRWKFIVNQKKSPVRGELACAASHREVWKQFLASDSSYALILEDDIQISSELKDFLEVFPENLGLDFVNLSSKDPYRIRMDDVAMPEGIPALKRPKVTDRKRRKQWRALEWRRKWRIFALYPMPFGNLICECDPAPALASGYVISRNAAVSLLTASESLISPIDLCWRYASGKLRQGFLVEPLISQVTNDSDIPGRFDQPRMSLCYRLLRPFSKNRRWKRRLDVMFLYGLLRH